MGMPAAKYFDRPFASSVTSAKLALRSFDSAQAPARAGRRHRSSIGEAIGLAGDVRGRCLARPAAGSGDAVDDVERADVRFRDVAFDRRVVQVQGRNAFRARLLPRVGQPRVGRASGGRLAVITATAHPRKQWSTAGNRDGNATDATDGRCSS